METVTNRELVAGAVAHDRIIVPVNGYPPNNRAVRVAEQLAAQFGCEIELASMLYDDSHHEDRQRLLNRMARAIKDRVVHVNLHGGTDPSPYILDLIHRPGALVVLAGGTTVLGIPGSITSDVLRFAPQPTVIVGPDVDPGWRIPIRRLVVPLDGSKAAEKALEPAAAWARACHASLDLVQVIDPADLVSAAQLGADLTEGAYLEQVAEALEPSAQVRVTWDVLHAPTSQRVATICDRARDAGTIICMATHGSRHTQSMMAATTLRVVHHASVPVLVIRS